MLEVIGERTKGLAIPSGLRDLSYIKDSDGVRITWDIPTKDAKRICKAVNNHDRLVAVLRKVKRYRDHNVLGTCLFNEVKEVLALLEEE